MASSLKWKIMCIFECLLWRSNNFYEYLITLGILIKSGVEKAHRGFNKESDGLENWNLRLDKEVVVLRSSMYNSGFMTQARILVSCGEKLLVKFLKMKEKCQKSEWSWQRGQEWFYMLC